MMLKFGDFCSELSIYSCLVDISSPKFQLSNCRKESQKVNQAEERTEKR